jgi:hypothetical protein
MSRAQEYFKRFQLAIVQARINLEAATEAKAMLTQKARLNSRLRCCACIHSKFEFEKGSTRNSFLDLWGLP